jgi:urease accessory protein
MLKLTDFAPAETPTEDSLILAFETRQKSRFSACTEGGLKVGLFLPRGSSLRSNAVITGPENIHIRIHAAPEQVSVGQTEDALLFARSCYHLGNRHIALQILPNEVRYLRDHVLDHMLITLGLTVTHERLPFEPEAGAYHSHEH